MDAGYKLTKDNPKKSANIFSKIFFIWLVRIFKKGVKKGIAIDDLYEPMASDNSEILTNKLEYHWIAEIERATKLNTKPSLIRPLVKTFFTEYMFAGFLFFMQLGLLRSFQPVLISLFIQVFSTEMLHVEKRTLDLYLYGSGLIALTIIVTLLVHHGNFALARVGMKARIACSSLIYRKALRLTRKSLGATASGQIVNLLSNDLLRFDLAAPILHTIWIIPIQLIIIIYFLWVEVQVSAFAGILAMIIMILPLQGLMAKLSTFLRKKVAARTDRRVKLMSELINGIHVIKMYVWEKPFYTIVQKARASEIKMLTYSSYIKGVYSSFAVFTERAALYFVVICYYILGNQITPDKVFSMAQFFNTIQLSMAIMLPLAVTLGAESLVTIKRLEEVLGLEEKKDTVGRIYEHKGISLEHVYASWTDETETLKNLTFAIPDGKLCAIIGTVGSGKSSILQMFLGELPIDKGLIHVNGEISYASQEPWLFISSVRQNIVYTEDYNRRRYKEIVKVCALERDLELFPKGDKTLVGERGVSLSGGQRARINLARAIYRDADIYLLDDPLSAVDTHVANHLFDECISKYLRGKTRILVTHQLQFLKRVDHIIVLNGGRIEEQGPFSKLMEMGSPYLKFLVDKEQEETENEIDEYEVLKSMHSRKISIASIKSVVSEVFTELNFDEQNQENITSRGFDAYKEYIKAGAGLFMMILLPCLLVFGQIAASACDYWIALWTGSKYSIPTGDYTYLYIYTGLIISCVILVTLRSIIFFKVCMNASQNLHDSMFNSILNAPMRFFDTNPSGRILNRFSRDMGGIDELLPRLGFESLQIFLVTCGILVMIAIANYYMVIFTLILGVLFLKVRSWYITTAKDIKHLEGIAKSPVFSHLSATLNGIVTIRATQSEDMLKREFDRHQNVHTSAWYLTIACIAAAGLWLDTLCLIFLICITYAFIIMEEFGQVNGSYVGLAISQAMILTGMLQYGVQRSAEVVNQMTSVERILDYTELEPEETILTSNHVTKTWPETGRITFSKLYLRYAESEDYILRNLNLFIQPGEKIGIVGRTGAGKSSIISALFRLAPIDGSIIIDEVDTNNISLSELRDKISIIPQVPVLFSSTIRYNLDPFGQFEDSELCSVLEEVDLKEAIPTLEYEIVEEGANFSVGQRQLICLARAMLRKNKILILDEATANVDHRTDALIQATIRRKFSSCTVLTVAHRLNTVIDSDKILVMSAGRMVEFDHPYKLLQNTNGFLHKMVLETGPAMTEQLFDIAAETYSNIKL